ncbi:MAG: anthranilate synthase component I [Acidobacteriota bacterium]
MIERSRCLHVFPEFPEFAEAAKRGNFVPVCAERLADLLTPVSAYLRVAGRLRRPFLLESAEGGVHVGRYSFLGGDPFLEVEGGADGVSIIAEDGTRERLEGDPVAGLAALQRRYRAQPIDGAPPFTGGAVGYVGYDAIRWVEDIPAANPPDGDMPWVSLAYYDSVLAFDHLRHRVVLVANARVENGAAPADLKRAYEDAVDRLERLSAVLDADAAGAAPLDRVTVRDGEVTPEDDVDQSLGSASFCAAVDAAKEYIAAGDAFQIVLSRRLSRRTNAQPLSVYRALRAINPSPYMFLLDTGAAHVVGSSPEMLVRVTDGVVENRPIAGTRPRGADAEEDAALEQQLLADEKERAEHLMLVDLGRNDVGRVAEYGSVRVPEFMNVERYSHVMHIVSSVKGTLRADLAPLQALFAAFPAGTVSGAPKIRAMEIIDELEPVSRGVYAGAILYADFAGNLDSCIAIRTIVMREGRAEVQAGAGIVADSVARREYEETSQKAAAALSAIAWASRAEAVAQTVEDAGQAEEIAP